VVPRLHHHVSQTSRIGRNQGGPLNNLPPSLSAATAEGWPVTAQLLPNGLLKTYKGFPHGMPTTQAETINADLLAFLRS
jgi:hypothetical protein